MGKLGYWGLQMAVDTVDIPAKKDIIRPITDYGGDDGTGQPNDRETASRSFACSG